MQRAAAVLHLAVSLKVRWSIQRQLRYRGGQADPASGRRQRPEEFGNEARAPRCRRFGSYRQLPVASGPEGQACSAPPPPWRKARGWTGQLKDGSRERERAVSLSSSSAPPLPSSASDGGLPVAEERPVAEACQVSSGQAGGSSEGSSAVELVVAGTGNEARAPAIHSSSASARTLRPAEVRGAGRVLGKKGEVARSGYAACPLTPSALLPASAVSRVRGSEGDKRGDVARSGYAACPLTSSTPAPAPTSQCSMGEYGLKLQAWLCRHARAAFLRPGITRL